MQRTQLQRKQQYYVSFQKKSRCKRSCVCRVLRLKFSNNEPFYAFLYRKLSYRSVASQSGVVCLSFVRFGFAHSENIIKLLRTWIQLSDHENQLGLARCVPWAKTAPLIWTIWRSVTTVEGGFRHSSTIRTYGISSLSVSSSFPIAQVQCIIRLIIRMAYEIICTRKAHASLCNIPD